LVDEGDISMAIEAAGVAAALYGAWRIRSLRSLTKDPRILHLLGFFLLLGLASAAHLGTGLVLQAQGGVPDRDTFDALDVLFWAAHLLLLAALTMALLAFGSPARATRAAPAVAPILLAGETVLRLLESLGFLYLLGRTAYNQIRKSNTGSLQVALGFFFLFTAQALFLLNRGLDPVPLGPRDVYGEACHLVGVLLLVFSAPHVRSPHA
jgi:hypothetical protein